MMAWFGVNNARIDKPGRPGSAECDVGSIDIRDGGTAVPYDDEDPEIRKEYEASLRSAGASSRMEDWRYRKPVEGEKRPNDDFMAF